MRFVFASVFAVFSHNKMRQPAGYTVQKIAELSISHRGFQCFPCVSPFASVLQCCCRHLTFCTCQLGLPFVLYLRAGVRKAGGEGGADDVHANADSVLCFSC